MADEISGRALSCCHDESANAWRWPTPRRALCRVLQAEEADHAGPKYCRAKTLRLCLSIARSTALQRSWHSTAFQPSPPYVCPASFRSPAPKPIKNPIESGSIKPNKFSCYWLTLRQCAKGTADWPPPMARSRVAYHLCCPPSTESFRLRFLIPYITLLNVIQLYMVAVCSLSPPSSEQCRLAVGY